MVLSLIHICVGFLNKAQTGSLKVVKTADDDKIEGRTFKITGTDFMGNPYEQEDV